MMRREISGGFYKKSVLDRISDPAALVWRSWVMNVSAGLVQTFLWIDPDPGRRIKQFLQKIIQQSPSPSPKQFLTEQLTGFMLKIFLQFLKLRCYRFYHLHLIRFPAP
jgi:hypothetical protein